MNPRIRTLANQAHEYALGVYDQRIVTEGQANVLFYQIRDDRFAQLIVQECIWLFGETRTEPSLERFILTRLGIENENV